MPVHTVVRAEGLREFRRAMKVAQVNLDIELKQTHKSAAELVADEARRQVPTRTGELKNTIRALASKTGGRVAAGYKATPYAGPIHWGWPDRNITAQPFLTNALDRRRGQVITQFNVDLEKLVNKAFTMAGVRRR